MARRRGCLRVRGGLVGRGVRWSACIRPSVLGRPAGRRRRLQAACLPSHGSARPCPCPCPCCAPPLRPLCAWLRLARPTAAPQRPADAPPPHLPLLWCATSPVRPCPPPPPPRPFRDQMDHVLEVTQFKSKAPWAEDPYKEVPAKVKSALTRSGAGGWAATTRAACSVRARVGVRACLLCAFVCAHVCIGGGRGSG